MQKDEYGCNILDNVTLNNNYFYLNEKKYFFKYIKNIKKMYNELVAAEIAKTMNISCLDYQLGTYEDSIVVFSEDFISNKIYIPMGDILLKKYGNANVSNNLIDIRKALISNYQNDRIVNSIMNDLYKRCMFNFLIANHDNHSYNYGIIKKDNKYSLSPSFDNENMLEEESIYDGVYALGIDATDYYSNNDIFTKFIVEYPKLKNIMSDYLDYISYESMKEIIRRVENNIEGFIPQDVKKYLLNGFEYNQRVLEKKIKNISI